MIHRIDMKQGREYDGFGARDRYLTFDKIDFDNRNHFIGRASRPFP
jgi:hypothetical protein